MVLLALAGLVMCPCIDYLVGIYIFDMALRHDNIIYGGDLMSYIVEKRNRIGKGQVKRERETSTEIERDVGATEGRISGNFGLTFYSIDISITILRLRLLLTPYHFSSSHFFS